jgi:hypothetical protein
MVEYLLATGAIWVTISIISSLGHVVVLGRVYKNMSGLLDEQTGRQRLPLYYIGGLAFALVFAYLLRMAWPAEVPLASGVVFGLMVGLAVYLPQALNQVATFPYPAQMVVGGAVIGVVQSALAGLVGAVIL